MTEKEYQLLINQIKEYDRQYYEDSNPSITDSEYDALYFKLQSYEQKHPELIDSNSPTQRLRIDEKAQDEIVHPYPLLSLQKAQDLETVESFLDKFKSRHHHDYSTNHFMLQLKEDGLTIAFYYNYFDQDFLAATRRTGRIKGQNVSRQLQGFKALNPGVPAIIRGEAIITNSKFEELNKDGLYMNPRNLVSGLLHRDAEAKDITFIAYNIENAEDFGIESEEEMLQQLQTWGFTTPSLHVLFKNSEIRKEELVTYIQEFEANNKRDKIDHDIDGLVIKPDYLANRRILGNTRHHPRNQLAYKFASMDAKTTLRKVIWQTGAKGNVTPVGVFDTINLFRARISKASLATMGNIKKRDIRIGDKIIVRRSNDVIPQIVKSFPEERTGDEIIIQQPENTEFNGEFLRVTSLTDSQLLRRWKIFVSKQGFDLKNISQKTIEQLAQADLIDLHDFSSLWQVDTKKLEALPGWSKKKVKTFKEQVQVKELAMPQFLVALAVSGIGEDLAKKISHYYPNPQAIINQQPAMTLDAWHNEFGQLSENFITALSERAEEIESLLPHVHIKEQTKVLRHQLEGQSFVVTGTAGELSRAEVVKRIEDAGGSVKKAVSRNVDYVVEMTEGTGSSKIDKANQLQIPVIQLVELLSMLN